MLPWWLEHNKKYFDHGVLFDYFSTDRSVEIIKDICPSWEVRKTVNNDWRFRDNDIEFMRAEKEFNGYKMVLTTTEFLVGDLQELPKEPSCLGVPLKRVIDIDPQNKPKYGVPLIEQKNTFYKEKRDKYKRRFLHNYEHGYYHVGRHSTRHPYTDISMEIYKYVFAPWTEEFIQRKLSMKQFMNPNDKERGRGSHHMWERKKLEEEYQKSLLKEHY